MKEAVFYSFIALLFFVLSFQFKAEQQTFLIGAIILTLISFYWIFKEIKS